jgi:hypothetical protein
MLSFVYVMLSFVVTRRGCVRDALRQQILENPLYIGFTESVKIFRALTLVYVMLSFVMLSGFLPFSHDSKPALFELIRRGDFEFPSPWWDDVSPEAKVCVCVCVCIQRERERDMRNSAFQRHEIY